MSVLVAVCRVHQLLPDDDVVGVTAIDKRPVDGPVKVNDLGLYGDVQADRTYHGGHYQALYAYAEESARGWEERLGTPIPPGRFGENLRTRGVAVDDAVIGERWQVGDTVVLEVTSPRTPCRTFGSFLGERSWPKRFTAAGLPGAYLRVVTRGHIAAGDAVRVVHRPEHGVTVARWFTDRSKDDARALHEAAASGELTMAPALRTFVNRSLRRA